MKAVKLKLIPVVNMPISIGRVKVKGDPRFSGRNGHVTFTGNLDADFTCVTVEDRTGVLVNPDNIKWQPVTIRQYHDTAKKLLDVKGELAKVIAANHLRKG